MGQIHPGDCVELMDQMRAKSVDLIVTSPPYNIKNSAGDGLKNGRGGEWPQAELIRGCADYDDDMPHEDYVEWQRRCLVAMMRVLDESGAIFYHHRWRVQGGLLQDRADLLQGFPVRQIIIWQRSGGINFYPGCFLPTHEVIYLIAKPKFRLAAKANAQGDVWRIPQETRNPHPAPFPLELAKRCIRSTNAKVVLDPFIGSGTTAIAAKNRESAMDWHGHQRNLLQPRKATGKGCWRDTPMIDFPSRPTGLTTNSLPRPAPSCADCCLSRASEKGKPCVFSLPKPMKHFILPTLCKKFCEAKLP